MFIDRARIRLTAGAGGNGCCSFRREKFVAHGGPDGGDGGDGGAIFLVATSRHNSLNHIRFNSQWKGKRGVHGQGSGMHGKRGEELLIEVPIGTVVTDSESASILCDLANEGDRYLALPGGKGGKGNARFATSTDRVPKFSELGEPGEELELTLELKLIADVGLVGLPNAGKSTFLSRISAATPKIADYPFTTLSPNLGVAPLSDHRTLTVADIPGIIEGAAEGKGLGHDFLRHIERTKVLLFLIDASDQDPIETLETLENELSGYSEEFQSRPRVVAFSKSDLPDNCEWYEEFKDQFDRPHLISSATGDGVDEMLERLWEELQLYNKELAGALIETPEEVEYTYEAPFTIRDENGGYLVEGKRIVRAVRMTDFANEEAVRYLDKSLKKMGLYKALARMGAKEGVTITIGGVEMEYHSA